MRLNLSPLVKIRLMQLYAANKFPSRGELEKYSLQLGIEVKKVRRWFQNRRAAEKRIGGFNLSSGKEIWYNPLNSFGSIVPGAGERSMDDESNFTEIYKMMANIDYVSCVESVKLQEKEELERRNVEILSELSTIIEQTRRSHMNDHENL